MCFKVVPVKISGNCGTKEIITHAFLDSGLDATFCLESLVQELELTDMKPASYYAECLSAHRVAQRFRSGFRFSACNTSLDITDFRSPSLFGL